MSDNPLKLAVLARLRHPGIGWKIHELYGELKGAGELPPLGGEGDLALFRSNFALMNALYTLQGELAAEGWYLQLESLDIRLLPLTTRLPETGSALRDYYLDWSNCWQTDTEEVDALLADFWRRYAAAPSESERCEALTLFGLEEGAPTERIRRRWRELALTHHPDRGGDAETFIRLRWAKERLLGNG
ncbi:DNA-J related domain-containing protein [Aeromonas schubertii]|uniref:Molecular chaperone n=1 Tax=Aeromonas schubertii TaxID=652 RepID=A0ABS7VGX4_9GAMM|nr:DNA-J related domain-containing protein [Aeromonas schubertii]MBZ6068188.1 molecular chaperone [Aeromonas schubertii]